MQRQGGFTLLEVLVAFAILVAGISIALSIQAGGMEQIARAEHLSQASMHARSLLDNIGVTERIEESQSNGAFDDDRYRWSMQVLEIEDPSQIMPAEASAQPNTEIVQPNLPRLYEIRLQVQWNYAGQTQSTEFVTVRSVYALEAGL